MEVHVSELTNNITLTVKGLRGWGIRLAIARVLFLAGARIIGVNIEIEA